MKAKQHKDWWPRAIADGVKQIINEIHTDEMITREIDYGNDDIMFGL